LVYSSSRSSSSTSDIDDVVWNMQHHSLWLLLRRCWRETRMNRDTHTHTDPYRLPKRSLWGSLFAQLWLLLTSLPLVCFISFFLFFWPGGSSIVVDRYLCCNPGRAHEGWAM
jgi:hypothetical protein